MSFGKLNQQIKIISSTPVKDSEGFSTPTDTVLATVRAYCEPRNSTEKWRNSAVFAEASALFRLRTIPGLTIDTTMHILCGGDRYNIISVENVRGRQMYYEILAEKLKPTVR